ncbi:MAG: aldo/keto reductase [Ignavibacteriae bacterium]|nr:aldo/keto reductase [Ignavibacteriota bacterium]
MSISKIGFDCYRIDDRVEEHYNSLRKAITNGITVIDTSANYSDGRSEILVGNVISDLISENKIKREDITLITKGGYIQGQNYRFAVKKKKQGIPFGDVVEIEDGLWHCISPDFLEDQINRQLFRLNQNDDYGYIDVYLLHNPEYFLKWAELNEYDNANTIEEYYLRIKKAFEFLEDKVAEGKIKSFGVSSNSFPRKINNFDFTSLDKIIECANLVKLENNFRFAEFPLNLVESGAILEKNHSKKSVLECAEANGIKTLINRPLNAITSKGLIRLADFEYNEISENELLKQVKFVCVMEDDLLKEKFSKFLLPPEDVKVIKSLITFGENVKDNALTFGSYEHLTDMIENYFSPRVNYLMDYFENKISDDFTLESFNKYINEVLRLFSYLSNFYRIFAEKRSKLVHTIINDYCDEKFHNLSLSQKAILLINSIDGVDCVLVGARQEKYVEDVLKIMDFDKIENAQEILEKIRNEIKNIVK